MKGLHTLNIGPGSDGKQTGAALVFPGDGTDPVRVPLNAHYIRQIELVVARAANDLGSVLYYALAMEDKGGDEGAEEVGISHKVITFHDPEDTDE